MDEAVFIKSDIGAQAAWKGFSSQTLDIAYRLVTDIQGYEYYPEDIEDIGTSIAGIDGYFKEYDKSLIRLSELTMDKENQHYVIDIC